MGPVALLVLNQPSLGNRVTSNLALELREACQETERSERTRVVVITGAGRTFSSGRQAYQPSVPSTEPEDAEGWLAGLRCASALANLTRPTIAAINGDAIDHGLELVLACDIRVAARNAKLGFTDIAEGIIPWDGGTQRLSRLVGSSRAVDILLTGRLVAAKEALAMGLVNKIAPNGEAALKAAVGCASHIAKSAPIAMRYAKEAVHKGRDMPLQQGLRLEADLNFLLHTTKDRKEGVESFLSKRNPKFTGR